MWGMTHRLMTGITSPGGGFAADERSEIGRVNVLPLTEPASTWDLEGVVFDCDGVLVDSEPVHDAATRDETRARGVTLSQSHFDEHIGMRVEDQMYLLARKYGLDPTALFEAREARLWAMIDRVGVPAIAGSVAVVRALTEAGVPVAVATSGNRRLINHVLDRLGIAADVVASVSGDDVTEPKPAPSRIWPQRWRSAWTPRDADWSRIPREVSAAPPRQAVG